MTPRLADAEEIVRHIIESAPWDGEEAHRQLLKEARAYFVKHPSGLCLLKTSAAPHSRTEPASPPAQEAGHHD